MQKHFVFFLVLMSSVFFCSTFCGEDKEKNDAQTLKAYLTEKIREMVFENHYYSCAEKGSKFLAIIYSCINTYIAGRCVTDFLENPEMFNKIFAKALISTGTTSFLWGVYFMLRGLRETYEKSKQTEE